MIKEANRVLKPKGKAAFSIWGIPEKSPLMTLLSSAIDNLKLIQPKNKIRSNFHLGGNFAMLKEKFLSNSFSHFVTWSQVFFFFQLLKINKIICLNDHAK